MVIEQIGQFQSTRDSVRSMHSNLRYSSSRFSSALIPRFRIVSTNREYGLDTTRTISRLSGERSIDTHSHGHRPSPRRIDEQRILAVSLEQSRSTKWFSSGSHVRILDSKHVLRQSLCLCCERHEFVNLWFRWMAMWWRSMSETLDRSNRLHDSFADRWFLLHYRPRSIEYVL